MSSPRSIFALFVLVLFLPFVAVAQEKVNAGFVEGLWFSEEPIFTDKPMRIYAALRNNTESDLTGTVVFKDGSAVIVRKDVSAISGRLIETWADWTPSYGEHTISATLNNAKLHRVGEKPIEVTVSSGLSENYVFVDRDTDNDGTGDKNDTDDDDDGVSDEEEQASGTDPLVANMVDETRDSTDEETSTDETAESEEQNSTHTESESGQNADKVAEGLEQYFDTGTVSTLLSNVTSKVHKSKEKLDDYRAERNTERKAAEERGVETPTETATNTGATPTGTENATITRTQLEPEKRGLFATLMAGIFGILEGLYTLLLWILSKLLGYPGLIQFLLLFAILIGVYKLAKRYGNRQQ